MSISENTTRRKDEFLKLQLASKQTRSHQKNFKEIRKLTNNEQSLSIESITQYADQKLLGNVAIGVFLKLFLLESVYSVCFYVN